MEYKEVSPLPAICENCQEEECYNCDYALDRWQLSPADELRSKRKLKEQALKRIKKEIAEIDRQLAKIQDKERDNTE